MRGAVIIAAMLVAAPAWAGYLEAEVDACLEAEMTLGIHGAAEACWRARQDQAMIAVDAWRVIRPDVVAACEGEDAVRVMACVWEVGR